MGSRQVCSQFMAQFRSRRIFHLVVQVSRSSNGRREGKRKYARPQVLIDMLWGFLCFLSICPSNAGEQKKEVCQASETDRLRGFYDPFHLALKKREWGKSCLVIPGKSDFLILHSPRCTVGSRPRSRGTGTPTESKRRAQDRHILPRTWPNSSVS